MTLNADIKQEDVLSQLWMNFRVLKEVGLGTTTNHLHFGNDMDPGWRFFSSSLRFVQDPTLWICHDIGDGFFYGSNDPTNSVKALNEDPKD